MKVQAVGVAGRGAESGSFQWTGCERRAGKVRSERCQARADSLLRGRQEYCRSQTAAMSRSIPRQIEGIPQRRPWWFTGKCVRQVRKGNKNVVVLINNSSTVFC